MILSSLIDIDLMKKTMISMIRTCKYLQMYHLLKPILSLCFVEFYSYLNYNYSTKGEYYTIIDFNEVDIGIYLPEKVIIHQGR